MPSKKTTVFISYAREDWETVHRLCEDLKKAGVKRWLDKEDLRPGTKWREELKRNIQESDYFFAILSSRAISKRGMVQAEIVEALKVLDQVPESQVFLVPVRLDECTPGHARLQELQWVDLFPCYKDGLRRILEVVKPECDWNALSPSYEKGLYKIADAVLPGSVRPVGPPAHPTTVASGAEVDVDLRTGQERQGLVTLKYDTRGRLRVWAVSNTTAISCVRCGRDLGFGDTVDRYGHEGLAHYYDCSDDG